MENTILSMEGHAVFSELEKKIEESIDKGLLLFIKNGELIYSIIGGEKCIHSSKEITEEIKKLKQNGNNVDIEEIVNQVIRNYSRPVFTLYGSTGLNRIHITCKEIEKVHYFITEEEIKYLLQKYKYIESNPKSKLIQYIFQKEFNVMTSVATHGVYIPGIHSLTEMSGFVCLETVINEFGM